METEFFGSESDKRLWKFTQLLKKYIPDDDIECDINGYKVTLWVAGRFRAQVRDSNNTEIFRACENDPDVLESKLEAFLKSKNIQV